MKRLLFTHLFLLLLTVSFAQKKIPSDYCITGDEMQLFNTINAIREEYDKKPVKLSASLSVVARTHCTDLFLNHPDTSICNLSSWSNKGKWTPCCYNAYLPKPLCMKKKPKELTPYPYYGYEVAAYFEDGYNLDSLVKLWGDTREVLDMILTRGIWEKKKWVVAGVGIDSNYVSIWFGQKPDKVKAPRLCKGKKVIKKIMTTPPAKAYFYIIIASFNNEADAKEALRRTKKSGFKEAGLLKGEKNTRVYLGRYEGLKEATHVKSSLSPTYRDAWILKK